jgi:hypothetical protein
MKQFELKDLETGKEYIVAYRNCESYYVPCKVKVVKEYTVRFIRPKNESYSPIEFGKEYSINDFFHDYRGQDIFGNKFRMLFVFDTMREALKWCIDYQNI